MECRPFDSDNACSGADRQVWTFGRPGGITDLDPAPTVVQCLGDHDNCAEQAFRATVQDGISGMRDVLAKKASAD